MSTPVAPASPPPDRSDLWVRAALLAIAVALLGRSIQIADGILWPGQPPTPIYWLIPSLLAGLAAVLSPLPAVRRRFGAPFLVAVCGLCLLFNLAQLGEKMPGNSLNVKTLDDYTPFLIGLMPMAALSALAVFAGGWLRHAAFGLLAVACLLLGIWLIQMSPHPGIDVVVFQRDATSRLAGGQNPYSMTFPDPYGGQSPWYGPGISVNGRLQFGYPYMPLTLLLTMPAHFMEREFRYAQLVAMIAAAALIAYARRGLPSFAGAALLLTTPRSFYILEQGWTEPFLVLLLAATVFCAVRLPKLLPVALGLFLASKQYVPAAVLLVPLLFKREPAISPPSPRTRGEGRGEGLESALPPLHPPPPWRALLILLLKAFAVAAAVTLPLALWDPAAFWKSAVALQVHQPYRWDSLSFLAWYGGGRRDWVGPAWLAFAALAIAIALALWRAPRGPEGFAAAVAICFFVFFAFNKQAFANYYYFVIGAMCCAMPLAVPAPCGMRGTRTMMDEC